MLNFKILQNGKATTDVMAFRPKFDRFAVAKQPTYVAVKVGKIIAKIHNVGI